MLTIIVFIIVVGISFKKNIREIYYHIPFVGKSISLKREIVEKKHRRRHTRALNVLYIINILVFIIFTFIQFFSITQLIDPETYITITNFTFAPLYKFEFLLYPWTVVTYCFIHTNFLHFASNILALFFISSTIRNNFKNKKILQIYLIGGIIGALFTMFFYAGIYPYNIEYSTKLIGASGSLFAFFGALYHKLPDHEYKFFIFKTKIKYVFWFLIITSILSIIFRYNVGGNLCHLGGALAGYLIVGHYKKLKSLIKSKRDK